MLALARTGPKDVVYDLGCGDGASSSPRRRSSARARRNRDRPRAAAHGGLSRSPRRVEDRVRFVRGDLFEADIGEATVVTLFLFETLNRRLLPKLLRELAPGRASSRTATGSAATGCREDRAGGSEPLYSGRFRSASLPGSEHRVVVGRGLGHHLQHVQCSTILPGRPAGNIHARPSRSLKPGHSWWQCRMT